MSAWTKEPWGIEGHELVFVDSDDGTRYYPGLCFDAAGGDPEGNARRIVACVNALAGIGNPAAVGDVIAATRDLHAKWDKIDGWGYASIDDYDWMDAALAALDAKPEVTA